MSEPLPPVRIRPRRIRVVAWVAAAVTLLAAVGLAVALSGPIDGSPAVFGPADRVGMVGLGVIGAAALLTLTRPLVEADTERIRVRNIVGGCELSWGLVRAVRFDRGASWATLELPDDEVVGVLAVQAVDKQHAVAAVRALRARHAAYQQRGDGQEGDRAGS
ncbi:MAG: PH domain-containing protein [Natronosporangium sp.]